MAKEQDNYKAFAGVNLSNARSENESYEDYKKRLKQNDGILKLYNTIGRDAFKEMFPGGIGEALKKLKRLHKKRLEKQNNFRILNVFN